MNVLVVDDEVYVTDGIKHAIDWTALGVTHIFTSYNMKQAQAVYNKHTIDILLCDIEMPKGSGLDLLSWVREQGYESICIFLTSHSNFNYANQAIRLESFDYILKPLPYNELTEVLKKAIIKAQKQKQQKSKMIEAQYWNDNRVQLIEHFWLRIAERIIPPDLDKIVEEASKIYLNEQILSFNYCPILFQLLPMRDKLKDWKDSQIEQSFKMLLAEELYNKSEIPAISCIEKNLYLIIVSRSPEEANNQEIIKVCQRIVLSISKALPMKISCYIDRFCSIEAISYAISNLINIKEKNIQYENTVYTTKKELHSTTNYEIPQLSAWTEGLFSEENDAVLTKIFLWLDNHAKNKTADKKLMQKFYYDFLQIIYIYLDKKGIQAHMLFQEEESERIAKLSTRSIEDMKNWVRHTIKKTFAFTEDIGRAESFIDSLYQYIHDHLGEGLRRNDLSAHVFLNPDYLSHIFKEKTGMSLTDYILSERIIKAKKLLSVTNLSIRDIAIKVGYPSISYFSKLFKRATQQTPLEYRKNQNTGQKL